MSTESSPGELVTVFAQVQDMLLSTEDAQSAVQQLAYVVDRMCPTAAGAGISLLDEDGSRTTAAATDDVVAEADDQQYALRQGPCLSAWATGQVQRIDDTTRDSRWPRWQPEAARLGIRSVLSAPLIYKQQHPGALKVYATTPNAFEDADEQMLALISGAVATLIGAAQPADAPTRLSDSLKTALRSRDTVALACGVIMAREGLGHDAARAALLDRARTQGRRVTDVAAEVVDRVQGTHPDRAR